MKHAHRRSLMMILVLSLALLSCWAQLVLAAEPPAVLDFQLDPVGTVPILRTDPLDTAALAAEDARSAGTDAPYRFAVPQQVAVTCAESGRWEEPTPLHRVWRLRVVAPGALSVNLGFTVFDLPPGGRLSLYPTDLRGPDDPRGVRVFRAGDEDLLGQLWTPVVLADDIVVEVVVPTGAARPRVELAAVNRGYRLFGALDREAAHDKAGSCNIDVVCPEGDDWREEINSVGVYTIDGIWKCTGALVNNTSLDGAPLFLTAYHCNNSMEQYANTVVVYWNYQSPVCGQHGGGTLDDFSTGAIFRATYQTSDFTLIELDDPLDSQFGCTLAGWDRRDLAPGSAVTIHHPSTDEKSISFENDPLTVTTYLQNDVPGDGTHLRITDWDLGTTEPGSSGSPLFDPEHHIIGQLHGGYAACGNDLSDWYGRLYTSWEGGGTPDSRLKDWLDPAGTGVVSLDLLDPARPELAAPSTSTELSVPLGWDFSEFAGEYVLRNISEVELPFQVTVDRDWVILTPRNGIIAPRDSVIVTMTLAPEFADLGEGTHRATISFLNLDGGLGDSSITWTVNILPVVPGIGQPVPNPFVDFTVVTYVLSRPGSVRARILDVRGRTVRDFGSLEGLAGPNELAWNGTDDQGRSVAAGLYILRLEAGDVTLQTSISRTR